LLSNFKPKTKPSNEHVASSNTNLTWVSQKIVLGTKKNSKVSEEVTFKKCKCRKFVFKQLDCVATIFLWKILISWKIKAL